MPEISGPDLLATLTELTVLTVTRAIAPYGVTEVVASGGGVRNPALMDGLRRSIEPAPLVTSDERGIPADGKEVVLWALLGFLTWHGLAGRDHRHRRTRGPRARPHHARPGAAAPAQAGRVAASTTPRRWLRTTRASTGRRSLMTSRTLGVSAALVDGELVRGDVRLDGDVVAEVGLPPARAAGSPRPGWSTCRSTASPAST